MRNFPAVAVIRARVDLELGYRISQDHRRHRSRHAMLSRFFGAFVASILVVPHAVAQFEPARCKFAEVGRLPLRYHGQTLALTTDGNINGSPAVLMLDTGAYDNVITPMGAAKRDLRMSPRGDAVTGTGGLSRLYDVPVRNFDVGPIRSSGRGTMKMIDETGIRLDYDAIVGAPFLLQLDMELSLAEKKISFFRGENCKDAFLGYWDKNAVQVPLSYTSSGTPFVRVELDGLKLRALIDTGADHSYVSLEALGKLGLTSASPGLQPVGQSAGAGGQLLKNYRYRFKLFSIGNEQINHPELRLTERLPHDTDMLLGHDFMRAHRILLAPSQNKVYLSYLGGAPFSAGGDTQWLRKEAEAGNHFAQYRMAAMATTAAEGQPWLNLAFAAGNPMALRERARYEEIKGRYAEAIALRQRALESDPFDLTAQLELFAVRTRAGQVQAAKDELNKVVSRQDDPHWPRPVADYYLGKLTLEDLLEAAAEARDMARYRRCDVYRYAGALLEARGDTAAAASLRIRQGEECRADSAPMGR